MKILKATGSAGKAYGHVPGHHYHDVDVTIKRTRTGSFTAEILETWGSAQGYDQELGRKKVIGRGDDLRSAVRDARERAKNADIGPDYVEEALSEAEQEAAEAIESIESIDSASPLATVSTEDLLAELKSRGVQA